MTNPFAGGFFAEVPDEVKKELERQSQLNHMARQDWQNALKRLLTETPIEHLVTIRKLVNNLIVDSSGGVAAFYDGWISSYLEFHHKVCAEHGVKDCIEDNLSPHEDASNAPEPEEKLESEGKPLTQEQLRKEQMVEYGVFPVKDSTSGEVYCVNCGHVSVSLADRMLVAPDKCPGCIHKSKWG